MRNRYRDSLTNSQLFSLSDVGERANETGDDSLVVDRTANHSDYPYFTIGSNDAMVLLIGLTFRENLFCFPQEPLAVIRVYISRVLRHIPWMSFRRVDPKNLEQLRRPIFGGVREPEHKAADSSESLHKGADSSESLRFDQQGAKPLPFVLQDPFLSLPLPLDVDA